MDNLKKEYQKETGKQPTIIIKYDSPEYLIQLINKKLSKIDKTQLNKETTNICCVCGANAKIKTVGKNRYYCDLCIS